MAARFADTMKALEAGMAKTTPDLAIENIEAWESHLEGLDVSGAKTVQADLGALRRALQKTPIEGAVVARLMAKLATGTLRIAGRAERKSVEQIEALGQALGATAQLPETA